MHFRKQFQFVLSSIHRHNCSEEGSGPEDSEPPAEKTLRRLSDLYTDLHGKIGHGPDLCVRVRVRVCVCVCVVERDS